MDSQLTIDLLKISDIEQMLILRLTPTRTLIGSELAGGMEIFL